MPGGWSWLYFVIIFVKNALSIIYIFINILIALDYSCLLLYFPQGRTGVPCSPSCALVVPSFAFYGCVLPSLRISVLDSAACAGVVEGLVLCGVFNGVYGPPGMYT